VTATAILLVLSAGCWILFLYPYLIYPQLLRLLSREAVRPAPVDLPVSLLFCAFNEVECLPGKIENLRALKRRHPALQILAYDDSSTDGTGEILAKASDVLTVIRGPGRTGKAAGMKQLVQHATGEVLIFTDANVLLSPDLVDRALPYYGDHSVGGLCCTIRMVSDPGSVTSQVGSKYIDLDDRLQQLESETGNVMGATGGLFSIRRDLYPEFPDTVLDDFTVSMSVVFQGKRLVKARDVIAEERTITHLRDELRRKVRIGARAYHTHAFLRPQIRRMAARDRMKYASRKLLRWFGGLFLALGAAFALAAVATLSVTAAVVLAVLGIVAFAVSMRSTAGILAKGRDLALATFATLVGVVQGMRGRTMVTWAPAKSR